MMYLQYFILLKQLERKKKLKNFSPEANMRRKQSRIAERVIMLNLG